MNERKKVHSLRVNRKNHSIVCFVSLLCLYLLVMGGFQVPALGQVLQIRRVKSHAKGGIKALKLGLVHTLNNLGWLES